jgi:hypothetical protein
LDLTEQYFTEKIADMKKLGKHIAVRRRRVVRGKFHEAVASDKAISRHAADLESLPRPDCNL